MAFRLLGAVARKPQAPKNGDRIMYTKQLRKIIGVIAAGGLSLAACAPAPATVDPTDPSGISSKADDTWRPIDQNEDPADLVGRASKVLSANISAADVGKTFGTPDDAVPYPDTYWPFSAGGNDVNGIDAHWQGASIASPLDKYMAIAKPGDSSAAKAAKDWERQNHGVDVKNVESWFGHCPGWTGAALSNRPILHPVFAKSDGQGGIQTCNQGSAGCTKFEIGDVNALMAEAYVSGNAKFIGERCDTKPDKVQRDKFGRITQAGCQGVNAGTLLVVASTLMKKRHIGFAIDAQSDFNTDQIWNQPAYSYTVNEYKELSEAEASKLVSGMDGVPYRTFNPAANGWVKVNLTINWVSEQGPNVSVVSGKDSTNTMTVDAVIELDSPASNSTATIIGGEYLDGQNGESRLTVPPFLWSPGGMGPENPAIDTQIMKQLISMGQQR
jgi:hypothetical protein